MLTNTKQFIHPSKGRLPIHSRACHLLSSDLVQNLVNLHHLLAICGVAYAELAPEHAAFQDLSVGMAAV